jgi:hypothetical protein
MLGYDRSGASIERGRVLKVELGQVETDDARAIMLQGCGNGAADAALVAGHDGAASAQAVAQFRSHLASRDAAGIVRLLSRKTTPGESS